MTFKHNCSMYFGFSCSFILCFLWLCFFSIPHSPLLLSLHPTLFSTDELRCRSTHQIACLYSWLSLTLVEMTWHIQSQVITQMCQLPLSHTHTIIWTKKNAFPVNVTHQLGQKHPNAGAQMKMNYAFCLATRNKCMMYPVCTQLGAQKRAECGKWVRTDINVHKTRHRCFTDADLKSLVTHKHFASLHNVIIDNNTCRHKLTRSSLVSALMFTAVFWSSSPYKSTPRSLASLLVLAFPS